MKSPTFDEPVHQVGGYCVLKLGDFRINPENGLLPQAWAAIPLALTFDSLVDTANPNWRRMREWALTDDFAENLGSHRDAALASSRTMMLVAAAFFLICMFFIALKIFRSKKAAWLVFLAALLSPTFTANAGLINSDLFSALFFVLAAYSFHVVLRRVTIWNFLFAAVSATCLFLSKLSAPIIIPIYVLLICIQLYRGKTLVNLPFPRLLRYYVIRGKRKMAATSFILLLSVGSVVFAGLWIVAGFRYSMVVENGTFEREMLEAKWTMCSKLNDSSSSRLVFFVKRHRLLPEFYLYGSAHVLGNIRNRCMFFNGERSKNGWRLYFPVVFCMKTPPQLILLFLIGAVLLVFPLSKKKHASFAFLRGLSTLYAFSPFLCLSSVYFLSAVFSNFNLGVRHILPIYACLYLLVGVPASGIRRLFIKTPSRLLLVCYIFLWVALVWENASVYPHLLSYFSPLVGGPANGYRHLVDSSLDWGQDLKGVKEYIKKHANDENNYISYFGSVNLKNYGVNAKRLPCFREQPLDSVFQLASGTYFISATMLQMNVIPEFADWLPKHDRLLLSYKRRFSRLLHMDLKTWESLAPQRRASLILDYRRYKVLRFAKLAAALRKRSPEHRIGNSIFVYKLSERDIKYIMNER
jgi:hypothetical protein